MEQLQEEPASIQPPAANPQRRDAVKMDTQVPSPTHPPVVINPAEDEDEDEDGGDASWRLKCTSKQHKLTFCVEMFQRTPRSVCLQEKCPRLVSLRSLERLWNQE